MKSILKSKINSFFSKYMLRLLLILFLFPFVDGLMNDSIGVRLYFLHAFGFTNIQNFYTIWIAAFGIVGVAYNISQNQKRIDYQEKQIQLQKEIDRDSRFAKSVELLGNNSESARTGAVYNLYFLAREFQKEYRETIFNILCTHVRTTTVKEEYIKEFPKVPSNEIHIILDLLFRQQNDYYLFEDLNANLQKSFLKGAFLDNALLNKVNLKNANLEGAYLRNADIQDSFLSRIILKKAHLENANFKNAQLYGACLTGAYLINTCLSNTRMNGVYLEGAYLHNTDFSGANMKGVKLQDAHIKDSKFDNVIMDDPIQTEI